MASNERALVETLGVRLHQLVVFPDIPRAEALLSAHFQHNGPARLTCVRWPSRGKPNRNNSDFYRACAPSEIQSDDIPPGPLLETLKRIRANKRVIRALEFRVLCRIHEYEEATGRPGIEILGFMNRVGIYVPCTHTTLPPMGDRELMFFNRAEYHWSPSWQPPSLSLRSNSRSRKSTPKPSIS